MKQDKPRKLPRGLRWKTDSPYIWFSWRDHLGKQHQQSTETSDPAKALGFKVQFLEDTEKRRESESQIPELEKLLLAQVAEFYFDWKIADSSSTTVARERGILKPILRFFGASTRLKSIGLGKIREYQQARRKQTSRTMKRFVSARTVNYELQLLRSVMSYAGCWTADLHAGYKPLRQIKSKIGRAASKEQLTRIFDEAKKNEYWQVAMYCAAVAPAGTEIYVILQRIAKEKLIQSARAHSQLQISNQSSMDELRELLQLQREMNQTPTVQLE